MADEFSSYRGGITAPASHGAALVPSDSTALTRSTRAIYVGTAGDLSVRLVSGDEVTLSGVIAGMIYPMRVSHVLATGTTAGGLVGLS